MTAKKIPSASEIRRRAKVATGKMTTNGAEGPDMDIAQVHNGVTTSWLAQAFDMDPKTVKKKLADCPYVQKGTRGQRVYMLKTAAGFLVTPKLDMESYMRTVKVEDLPPRLQDGFWSAQNKKQKWEENAGELWRTSKVLDCFSRVFQRIKFSMQLWTDTLERATELTPEQQEKIAEMVAALLEELFKDMTSMGMDSQTRPTIAELEVPKVPEEDHSDVL